MKGNLEWEIGKSSKVRHLFPSISIVNCMKGLKEIREFLELPGSTRLAVAVQRQIMSSSGTRILHFGTWGSSLGYGIQGHQGKRWRKDLIVRNIYVESFLFVFYFETYTKHIPR